ncbi:hypothetical protein N7540_012732 [Penicillium herquei]|nr:hypothetical protein N7540_012732 [Penicillium herquei]
MWQSSHAPLIEIVKFYEPDGGPEAAIPIPMFTSRQRKPRTIFARGGVAVLEWNSYSTSLQLCVHIVNVTGLMIPDKAGAHQRSLSTNLKAFNNFFTTDICIHFTVMEIRQSRRAAFWSSLT